MLTEAVSAVWGPSPSCVSVPAAGAPSPTPPSLSHTCSAPTAETQDGASRTFKHRIAATRLHDQAWLQLVTGIGCSMHLTALIHVPFPAPPLLLCTCSAPINGARGEADQTSCFNVTWRQCFLPTQPLLLHSQPLLLYTFSAALNRAWSEACCSRSALTNGVSHGAWSTPLASSWPPSGYSDT